MPGDWISAAEAFKLVSDALGSNQAGRAICSRAFDRLIPARAVRLTDSRGNPPCDSTDIPREFWWARGEVALTQNWKTGDFSTWIGSDYEVRAYGVSFSRQGIEALIEPAGVIRQTQVDAPTKPGGRPPAAWWDDLWVEICRQIYVGDLQPKKQADIEDAMNNWVSARGFSAADSTIRPRARKLWAALDREDKN